MPSPSFNYAFAQFVQSEIGSANRKKKAIRGKEEELATSHQSYEPLRPSRSSSPVSSSVRDRLLVQKSRPHRTCKKNSLSTVSTSRALRIRISCYLHNIPAVAVATIHYHPGRFKCSPASVHGDPRRYRSPAHHLRPHPCAKYPGPARHCRPHSQNPSKCLVPDTEQQEAILKQDISRDEKKRRFSHTYKKKRASFTIFFRTSTVYVSAIELPSRFGILPQPTPLFVPRTFERSLVLRLTYE